jgi:WD40 repeat protein
VDIRTNFIAHQFTDKGQQITSTTFHPSGRWIMSTGSDSSIKIWDIRIGHQMCTLNAHEGASTAVSCSPCGNYMYTGGEDQRVIVWKLNANSRSTSSSSTPIISSPAIRDTKKSIEARHMRLERVTPKQTNVTFPTTVPSGPLPNTNLNRNSSRTSIRPISTSPAFDECKSIGANHTTHIRTINPNQTCTTSENALQYSNDSSYLRPVPKADDVARLSESVSGVFQHIVDQLTQITNVSVKSL